LRATRAWPRRPTRACSSIRPCAVFAITTAGDRIKVAETVDWDELRDLVIEMLRGIPNAAAVIDDPVVVRIPRRYPVGAEPVTPRAAAARRCAG
jgi:hypothetical protein